MEYTGGQCPSGPGLTEYIPEMLHVTGSSRCNDGNGNGPGNQRGDFECKPVPGAVMVHRGEQDLAGPEVPGLTYPVKGVQTGIGPSSVYINGISRRQTVRTGSTGPGINGNDNALAAKVSGQLGNQLGTAYSG